MPLQFSALLKTLIRVFKTLVRVGWVRGFIVVCIIRFSVIIGHVKSERFARPAQPDAHGARVKGGVLEVLGLNVLHDVGPILSAGSALDARPDLVGVRHLVLDDHVQGFLKG